MASRRKKSQKVDDGRGVPKSLTSFVKQREMPQGEQVRDIPRIGNIQPVFNPVVQQALPELDEDARTRLYISLLTHGLLTPITLVQMGDYYIVLDGHERLEIWANIVADIPDWSPPLPLRVDVIPVAAIVGDELVTARCDCLLAARAISINVARRQLDDDSVESIIKTHVLREWNDAQMQRTSNWLASDLGCSPNWVTEIRRRMWHDKDLVMPPTLEGKSGARVNPDWKRKETTPEPVGHQVGAKDHPISPEELEDKEEITTAPQGTRGPENEADKLVNEVGPVTATQNSEQPAQFAEQFPGVDNPDSDSTRESGRDDANPYEEVVGPLENWDFIQKWNQQQTKPIRKRTLHALNAADVYTDAMEAAKSEDPLDGENNWQEKIPLVAKDRLVEIVANCVDAYGNAQGKVKGKVKKLDRAEVEGMLRDLITPWL